jgi:hypothetical protein
MAKIEIKEELGKVEIGTISRGSVIGVAVCGEPNGGGAPLVWIDEDFNVISELPSDYFDKHPSFIFPHVIIEGNHFRSIPVAYWKRGTVPEGKPNAGNWFMMLSDTPRDGFSANGAAFKKNGVLKDCFLYGAYRARNNNGVPGSMPNEAHWGDVSFQKFKGCAASIGDGYHMVTLQEFHEILARAVVEKKTFNLWRASKRLNREANNYRGIEEMAYHGDTWCEWRDGVRTNDAGNFEVLDSDGFGSYVDTGIKVEESGFISELLSGSHWDHMFVAAKTCYDRDDAMIPNYTYNAAGCVCLSSFNAGYADGGAFCSYWDDSASRTNSGIGGRLAKI